MGWKSYTRPPRGRPGNVVIRWRLTGYTHKLVMRSELFDVLDNNIIHPFVSTLECRSRLVPVVRSSDFNLDRVMATSMLVALRNALRHHHLARALLASWQPQTAFLEWKMVELGLAIDHNPDWQPHRTRPRRHRTPAGLTTLLSFTSFDFLQCTFAHPSG